MSQCREPDPCLYCGNPVARRHEHDHFPVPERLGGKQVFCVCFNCHELKDRTPLEKWQPIDALRALAGVWSKANASERIVIAKLFAAAQDGAFMCNKYCRGAPPPEHGSPD